MVLYCIILLYCTLIHYMYNNLSNYVQYYIVFGWFWLWYVLQCFCSAMKGNVTFPVVQQYNWRALKRNVTFPVVLCSYVLH